MDALSDFEDKLKFSTRDAILLLACSCFALVCVCIVIILKRKACNNKIVHQEGDINENESTATATTTSTTNDATPMEWSEPSCGWISVKRVLWSRATKVEDNIRWQKDRGSPLLRFQRHGLDESGWQSHNSTSAVWQRPILRGEKCELPSFSGLILYDEKGRLLRDSEIETQCIGTSEQEKTVVAIRTTLRDLL
ncbi:hypothetical protein RIF29_30867 [Crotalaria pallida]|uniref:Transmembrane protein n=1 Tax=Crotalaria pallida TaxID=3830 RepID=A0AAN9I1I2_CROPI